MSEFNSVFRDEIGLHLSLRQSELSHEAYRHCRRTIVLFDEYLCKIGHADKVIPESVIEGWIKEVSMGISLNTSSQHVHNIRQLLMFLVNSGYRCFIPRTIIRHDIYVPYLYSDDDLKKIFDVADSMTAIKARKNQYAAEEMPMILRLLYCCGLRVGETVNIKVGDLDFDRNLLVLRVTKKYKQRLVPFGQELSEMIHHYCIGLGISNFPDAYLFPAEDFDNHISTSSVGNYYRTIRELAGISPCQPVKRGRGACLHCFRHSFAVRSFDKNERNGIKAIESVPYLSTYLGHDGLYETEKYLKFSGNYFEDTLRRFDDYSGELFPEVVIHE